MSKPRIHLSRIILGTVCTLIIVINVVIFVSAKVINAKIFERPANLPASFCATSDKTAPEITLNGDIYTTILVNTNEYEELGAVAIDDCDEVEFKIDGVVDTRVVGTYIINYTSEDKSGNLSTAIRTVNVIPENHGTVYLTFDDGPGDYTAELLDVLNKYNVKATFFVTGRGSDEMILREYQEGHTVGLHTSSHDYSYIYQNINTFFEDLYSVQERVKNITGYTSYLMRFPGGSSNTVSRRYDGGAHIMSQLVDEVESRGFTYFDWNISSGDAASASSPEEVFENVAYALKEYGDSVVLQHDIKEFSVAAVEQIIQYGLSNGYKFAALDASSFTAHHGVNN
ncbi:polysaccharide deacetylase family protein [Candidatus Saccharibacteria bacterium]|nr:polysaccharide deacetylase family protein [Candidatus Saccharibacteria bacterium]